MLFGVGVSSRILHSIVSYLITSVGEERANLSAIVCLYAWVLFGEVSSSSWCLRWAAMFYCGTPWAIHIITLDKNGILHFYTTAYMTDISFLDYS